MVKKQSTRMRSVDRRRQLLDVASGVFADRGFSATIMDDIAYTAGVTKPVLYQHFDSKRALFIAVLEDCGERLVNNIVTATREGETLREQMMQGFTAYFDFVRNDDSGFRLLFGASARNDTDFAEVTNRVLEHFADSVTSLIIEDIPQEERSLIAHALIGMAESAARFTYLSGTSAKISDEQLHAWVTSLAWKGLRGISD
ncbi:MAG TPA: TetR/AcrR family transcriptional regulator [Acidimicrobiia bacterium]|jgi:AcrR family transcriptional regulator|nr:TetR/AcrR family transcriptional regulator [Acidimicrobiia bacterium]